LLKKIEKKPHDSILTLLKNKANFPADYFENKEGLYENTNFGKTR
jgi:hypothetical protein